MQCEAVRFEWYNIIELKNMKTYLRLMLFIFCVYFPARCSPSPRRSPRVEPYGWLSGFVVFTCSLCLFLTPLIYLQLVHEVLACFFPTICSARCAPIPRPEALELNLTADYLCLSSLHVPSACFLHINFALHPARTWGPGLFFLTCSSVCRSIYPGHVICNK